MCGALPCERPKPRRTTCHRRRAHLHPLRALHTGMPCSCTIPSQRRKGPCLWGACMIRLVILGDSLASLSSANHVKDLKPEIEIQIITERAEIGLVEETPGLLPSWPPCPAHWISEMRSQTPEPTSDAVRGSWLLKAMGTQLAKRGCIFHLRTRTVAVSSEKIDLVGAGPIGEGSLTFDYLLDFSGDNSSQPLWYGAVCRSEDSPESPRQGSRSDGTTELWSSRELEQNGKWIQTMLWRGEDPNSYIHDQVEMGKERAENVIESIIQSTSRE